MMNKISIQSVFKLLLTVITLLAAVAAPVAVAANNQSAEPYLTAKRFNLAGQVVGIIHSDPDGAGSAGYPATRHQYDPNTGLIESTQEGELSAWMDLSVAPDDWTGFSVYRSVEYDYDSIGRLRLEKVADKNGSIVSVTQYSYTQYDQVKCKAVRMNPSSFSSLPSSACVTGAEGSHGEDRITRYTYNAQNQIKKEFRAADTEIEQVYRENIYDSHGRLSGVKDANGNYTEYRYNANFRLSRTVYPSKTQAGAVNESDYKRIWYDLNGNVTKERKRSGATISYQYDNLNRKIYKDRSDNSSKNLTYTYDLRGLQTKVQADHYTQGTITNDYDGFGRLTQQTTSVYPNSFTFNYTYDKNGNRKSIVYPDGVPFFYDYDALNRIEALSDGTRDLVGFEYDALSNIKRLNRSSGADTVYSYDDALRLESINHNLSGSTYDNQFSYGYNPAGQITSVVTSNSYYYQGDQVSTSGYDSNGLNQYTSVGGQTIGYDTNGNLTQKGSVSYEYDIENRLVKRSSGGTDNLLGYDPAGRLRYVTASSGNDYFAYDGDSLAAEYDAYASGGPKKRYVHAPGFDRPMIVYDGSSIDNPEFLHRNHQGSIVAASNKYGSKLYINTYDAFGIPGSNNQGRFGYTGQVYLEELSLYHYKARAYDPSLGRFLQTDPIGYEDQMNLYAYVHNDPVTNIDPTGMQCYSMSHGAGSVCAGAALLNSLKGEQGQAKSDNNSVAQHGNDTQEAFSSSAELADALGKSGLVFGKRPLGAAENDSPPSSDPLGSDQLNFETVHEQVFFTDSNGSLRNIGFFKGGEVDGVIQSDPGFPDNIGSYRFGPIRQSVNLGSLDFSPSGFSVGSYNFLFNNCQDYCSAIRRQID